MMGYCLYITELLKCKCLGLPVLLYGLEVCALDKRALRSLDFSTNRLFMKLLNITNMEIIKACQEMFNRELPSVQLIE